MVIWPMNLGTYYLFVAFRKEFRSLRKLEKKNLQCAPPREKKGYHTSKLHTMRRHCTQFVHEKDI